MPTHSILIVEDQVSVRRMLRAAIQSLDPQVDLIDVPSGEEAWLVLTEQPVSLLILDIRLAGISGFELMQKAKHHQPELKVILLTGLSDREIRRKITQVGAEASFLKPVEMDLFLQAVADCIAHPARAASEEVKPAPDAALTESEPEPIPDRLSRLCTELGARSAVLIDDSGRILDHAGDISSLHGNALVPALRIALQALAELSRSLGGSAPEDLLCISTGEENCYLTHTRASQALWVTIPLSNSQAGSEMIIRRLLAEADALRDADGYQDHVQPEVSHIQSDTVEASRAFHGERISELEEVLNRFLGHQLDSKKVDAFWEEIVGKDEPERHTKEVGISYEQARSLGLVSDQEPRHSTGEQF